MFVFVFKWLKEWSYGVQECSRRLDHCEAWRLGSDTVGFVLPDHAEIRHVLCVAGEVADPDSGECIVCEMGCKTCSPGRSHVVCLSWGPWYRNRGLRLIEQISTGWVKGVILE